MIDKNNKYTRMQKEFYEDNSTQMNECNHFNHNENPEYWDILLGEIIRNPSDWIGKIGMDFGCGCGRNLINLQTLLNWKKLVGIDISENNLKNTKENYYKNFGNIDNLETFVSNGIDLNNVPDEYIDFTMSTIVLQHICVYEIRYSILKEIYRILKWNGLFSFQMGYSEKPHERNKSYYDNFYDAEGTNSICDCAVSDPMQIVSDLVNIGFKENKITYRIGQRWYNEQHENWIYVKCYKEK
jgi:ubiquinone/menaquinone biosynthesis C-methylase UbiE